MKNLLPFAFALVIIVGLSPCACAPGTSTLVMDAGTTTEDGATLPSVDGEPSKPSGPSVSPGVPDAGGPTDAESSCTECPKGCFDLDNDAGNCGSCGYACPAGPPGTRAVCEKGACKVTCPGGRTVCANGCFDIDSDPGNCGGCGKVCDAPLGGIATCSSGKCVTTCDTPGFEVCGGRCVDKLNDVNHCGSCSACQTFNGYGVPVCTNGGCEVICTPTKRCSGATPKCCFSPGINDYVCCAR